MKKVLLGLMLIVFSAALIFGSVYRVEAVLKSTNVLVVLSPSKVASWPWGPIKISGSGGTLPSLDPAFGSFVFNVLPGGFPALSSVTIAGSDTIVLVVSELMDISTLTAAQKTLLNNFVYNGGKLIIYDGDRNLPPSTVDFTWLAYPFTDRNPGARGYMAGAFTFVEDNTLGSTNALRPDNPTYYIDNTTIPGGAWEDYVGDCNTFVTYDPHWCGDIKAYNRYSDPLSPGYDGSPPSWAHAYAMYGNGLFIYNGFDIDPMKANLAPSTVGIGNCAKIWLMELNQPWGADYNLPCDMPIAPPVPVGGYSVSIGVSVTKLDSLAAQIGLVSIALPTVVICCVCAKHKKKKGT